MAAPAAAYHSTVLNNSTDAENYAFAKYGYSTDYDTEAEIKAVFYLDNILRDVTLTPYGFIGIVSSAFNKSMHAASRKLDIGNSKYLLKDAGLHTFPYCDFHNILSSDSTDKDQTPANYPPRINNTVAWQQFKSAYYVDSSQRTLQMRSEDNYNIWNTIENYSTQNMNYTSTIKSSIVSLNKSGNHYFRCVHTNAEGTFYSDEFTANIRMAIFSLKYSASNASESFSGTTYTRYANTGILADEGNVGGDATQLFSDEGSPPTHTANGYYALGSNWYQYGYSTTYSRYHILDFGTNTPGGYPPGDPGNIVTNSEEWYYRGYDGIDQSSADTEVLSGNYDAGYIYLYQSTNYENTPPTTTYIAYTDAGHNYYAQQGYYAYGSWELASIERQIEVGANGTIVYDYIY